MAFHASNATMISSIVCFKKNYTFIYELLCGFNVTAFLQKYYDSKNQKRQTDELLIALQGTKTNPGLRWNSNKNKSEKKDVLAKRYAETLLDCALFLRNYTSKDEFLSDLVAHYQYYDYKILIEYFMSHFSAGYSIALSCDFLKEYDAIFSDLPKPDVHIRDVLSAYYGKQYSKTKKGQYDCIGDFQVLVKEINAELSSAKQITVYQFDRMLWLICSGKFFFDDKNRIKAAFLERISKK